jgi:aminoglycoside/choline kinase family phosphotransferase
VWGPDGGAAIVAEYPAAIRDQMPRDLEVLGWCRHRGLRVPHLLGADLAAGRLLLEDLGAEDAEAALEATPCDDRSAFLQSMLGPLEILARCRPDELPPWNPPLDRTRLRWELAGFELWYVRHLRGRLPSQELGRWLDGLAMEVGNHPRRVCHRDYHLNNILIPDDGTVAVIDVQDILVGPDTYDVVSLVAERAARRLVSETGRRKALAVWAEGTRAEPGWADRALSVRLQRGLKVLGTFARFTLTGRTEYRSWMAEHAADLAALLEILEAPPGLTAFLVD